ncbi:LIM-domain binding protein-domain-containing protein [Schizophyllum amplum]|uniref:LIM-domain binding protein-domain-containing protein n=1 Tax=Schizophyllum amplum TaxID=97359 RepID=A0A550CV15_9AGAR|nr:LIM-domain binding protein-domain-containing protein [Auriculariopsis ampla]
MNVGMNNQMIGGPQGMPGGASMLPGGMGPGAGLGPGPNGMGGGMMAMGGPSAMPGPGGMRGAPGMGGMGSAPGMAHMQRMQMPQHHQQGVARGMRPGYPTNGMMQPNGVVARPPMPGAQPPRRPNEMMNMGMGMMNPMMPTMQRDMAPNLGGMNLNMAARSTMPMEMMRPADMEMRNMQINMQHRMASQMEMPGARQPLDMGMRQQEMNMRVLGGPGDMQMRPPPQPPLDMGAGAGVVRPPEMAGMVPQRSDGQHLPGGTFSTSPPDPFRQRPPSQIGLRPQSQMGNRPQPQIDGRPQSQGGHMMQTGQSALGAPGSGGMTQAGQIMGSQGPSPLNGQQSGRQSQESLLAQDPYSTRPRSQPGQPLMPGQPGVPGLQNMRPQSQSGLSGPHAPMHGQQAGMQGLPSGTMQPQMRPQSQQGQQLGGFSQQGAFPQPNGVGGFPQSGGPFQDGRLSSGASQGQMGPPAMQPMGMPQGAPHPSPFGAPMASQHMPQGQPSMSMQGQQQQQHTLTPQHSGPGQQPLGAAGPMGSLGAPQMGPSPMGAQMQMGTPQSMNTQGVPQRRPTPQHPGPGGPGNIGEPRMTPVDAMTWSTGEQEGMGRAQFNPSMPYQSMHAPGGGHNGISASGPGPAPPPNMNGAMPHQGLSGGMQSHGPPGAAPLQPQHTGGRMGPGATSMPPTPTHSNSSMMGGMQPGVPPSYSQGGGMPTNQGVPPPHTFGQGQPGGFQQQPSGSHVPPLPPSAQDSASSSAMGAQQPSSSGSSSDGQRKPPFAPGYTQPGQTHTQYPQPLYNPPLSPQKYPVPPLPGQQAPSPERYGQQGQRHGGEEHQPSSSPQRSRKDDDSPRFSPRIDRVLNAGAGVIRLSQFSGMMAVESETKKSSLKWWTKLISEYFVPSAFWKFTLFDYDSNSRRVFNIPYHVLPQFFLTTAEAGNHSSTFTLPGLRERVMTQVTPTIPGHIILECADAIWTWRYKCGWIVNLKGPMTIHIRVGWRGQQSGIIPGVPPPPVPPQPNAKPLEGSFESDFELKFAHVQFDALDTERYVRRDHIEGSVMPEVPRPPPAPPSAYGENLAPDGTTTMQPPPPPDNSFYRPKDSWDTPVIQMQTVTMPADPVNGFGIPQPAMRTLELMESVATLEDLMSATMREGWSPKDSIEKFTQGLRKKGMKLKPISYPMHDDHTSSLFLDPLPQFSTPAMSNSVPQSSSSTVQIPPPGSANGTPAMGHAAPTLFTSAPPNVTNPGGAASTSATPGVPTPNVPPPNQNLNMTPSSTTASPQTATNATPHSSPQKQHKQIPPPRNRNTGGPAPQTAGVKRKQSTSNADPEPAPKRAPRKRKSTAGG